MKIYCEIEVNENKANSNPIGEDRYKTKDPRHKTKDTSLETEVRRQSIGLWLGFFAGGKLDIEINFSLWPDKKSGWLKKCRVAKTMETKCAISSDVA